MTALKIIGALAAVSAVAVVAVGAAMYFRLIPIPGPILALLIGAQTPEYSARYYPPDTVAYAWVTLAPGGKQMDYMQETWDRFNEFRAFRRLVDELQAEFEEETGLDFDHDIAPWIGPDASAGFVDYDSRRDEFVAMAVIGVRDEEAARDFLRGWLEYLEDNDGADFTRSSYKDFETWVDEDVHQAYALDGESLAFATTANGLEEIIDGIAGDIDRSLADSERFQEARDSFASPRFASVYVDLHGADDLWEEFDDGEFQQFDTEVWGNQDPEWLGGTATWNDRALATEVVLPLGIDYPLQLENLEDPARLAPADTLLLVAGAFDPDVSDWRAALRHYDLADSIPSDGELEEINRLIQSLTEGDAPELRSRDDLSDALDVVLWVAEDATGIDLERDLLDHLAGEAILVVSDADFERVADDPLLNPVDAGILLSHRENGERPLSRTVNDVADMIEERLDPFIDVETIRMGPAGEAILFHLDGDFVETDYSPGLVLNGGYLTIGTTEGMLEELVDLQNGESASLASRPGFAVATGHLPGDLQSLIYLDLRRIIRQLDPDDVGLSSDEFDILESSIGAFAFGSHSPHCLESASLPEACDIPAGADVSRLTAVLTLFPE